MSSKADVQALLRPEVADLEEYTPIQPLEVLSQRLGIPAGEIVKLDANENPYGPAPAVAEALAEYPYYHIYPDPQQAELRDALSDFTGVPAANILPTHGADEMLDYLCRLFLRPGDAIINCPPTFGMYSFDAGLSGAQTVNIPRTPDYSVDVPAIKALFVTAQKSRNTESHRVGTEDHRDFLEKSPRTGQFHEKTFDVARESALRTPHSALKILFLTSPNNPSGNWMADDDLRRLLNLPLLVVLDEAYVEFADHPSRAAWVLERENLVVLRTFSKAAGIAGLRLGYGICPDWLMAQLWKFKQPYNVNVAATVAGLASLRHVDQIYDAVARIKVERARLFAGLERVPYLEPQPSEANFILCRVVGRDAAALKQALEPRGILVRYYRKPGLENCIRISVGRPEQTDRLLDALAQIVS